MIKLIQIEINCGEETCASEPGKFCAHLGSMKFGSVPVCLLFRDPRPSSKNIGGHQLLQEVDGWVDRCPQCLAATSGKVVSSLQECVE